ncbi:MAG: hypothetical protein ACI8RD_001305, partial [Bacillariaceae sp.]|jgi:hypothetical protein
VLHALFRAFQIAVGLSLIGIIIRYNHKEEIIQLEIDTGCTGAGSTEDNMTYVYSSVSIIVAGISLGLVVPMFRYSGMGTPVSNEEKLLDPKWK